MSKKTTKQKRSRKNQTPARKLKPGLGLIFWGVALVLIFAGYRVYSLNILSFGVTPVAQVTTGPAPVKVEIPQVNVNLMITEATVTDGTWEISPDGASHWDNSANPGQGGNIVVYSHNKTDLFGPIRWLNLGDEIVITDADGNQHLYTITETVTVSPKEVGYILPKDEEVLTLYTCTGLFDSQRYIVIAKPKQV
jgi:LPXTG-site transpeptidase (sortase) family protein